jgi:hypothetical protein
VPPHPTVRELAGDAYSEIAGWDGKLALSIRLLLRRPGELTRLLLDGQRAQFISPVRLYLTCSVVYFIVAAAAPAPTATLEVDAGVGFSTPASESAAQQQTAGQAALVKAINKKLATLTPAERALAEAEIARQPALARPMFRAMAEDNDALKRRATEAMPRALFVLIPALAGILALFYRRRNFPEHLYFAIHFEAFAFLALTVAALAQFAGSLTVVVVTQFVAMAVMAAYGVMALRRVYGGSWLATGLKAAGIGVLYSSLWAVTTFAVTLWASRS